MATSASSMTTTTSSQEIADHIRGLTSWDDATWILTSSFIIFTMQSGFGLLESGFASRKNEVNVMVKNVADVIFGGLSFWMLGYGFSFGADPGSNPFCGLGRFFLNPGALAERTNFIAYVIFSFFNTFVYCFPAHWVWAPNGWLHAMGMVDVAGCGPVHVVGGFTALMAAILVKPRARRFTPEDDHDGMGAPVSCLLGTLILWWGWLAFNCGSTYGISEGKWKIAARSAANTLLSSCGGGASAFLASYFLKNKTFDVGMIISGILGALVSVTGVCGVTGTWEAIVIGATGGLLPHFGERLLVKLKIDDPVGAFPVHGMCGTWGLLCAGIFAHKDMITRLYSNHDGLFKGGGWHLLGLQTLAVVVLAAWSCTMSCIFLKLVDLLVGLRVSPEDEELGADFVEHNIRDRLFLPSTALPPPTTAVAPPTSSPVPGGEDGSSPERSCFSCCKDRRRRKKSARKVAPLTAGPEVKSDIFIISKERPRKLSQDPVSSRLCLVSSREMPEPDVSESHQTSGPPAHF